MDDTKRKSEIHVSVVIPAYNIEGYIQRAIDSALSQNRLPDEIIVVDDGSTDATAEKIQSYGDKVRYIYQDNRGLSGARNTGIRQAKYDWIAFLDGDDEWLSEHLALQIQILQDHLDLMWTTGNYIRCLCREDRQAVDVNPADIEKRLNGKRYFDSFFEAHVNRAIGNSNTMVIHKKVFDQIGLFNEKQAFAEDIEMWWRIAFKFPKIGYLSVPQSIYHLQRPGTLSEGFKQNKMDWLVKLVEKNQAEARNYNMIAQFDSVVKFLVTSWIRGLLFENKPQQIKMLIDKFDRSLSPFFKSMVCVLMICPKGTAVSCHLISKLVRMLNLRKKITRKPAPLSK